MIETYIKTLFTANGQELAKTFAKVADLHGWTKNPKDVSEEDFARLIEMKKLGQFSPLLVMIEDGTVIGGNTRLKMYKSDGDEEAWISPLEFVEKEQMWFAVIDGAMNTNRAFSTKEQAMIEYALADNDQIGRYNSQSIAELVAPYQNVIPLKDYRVDIARPVNVQSILDSLQPSSSDTENMEDRAQDLDDTDEKLDTYLNGTIRQIVLYFTVEEYQTTMERLDKIMTTYKLKSNTDLFLKLLTFYETNQALDDSPIPSNDSEEQEVGDIDEENPS